jgi:hypothetical protein
MEVRDGGKRRRKGKAAANEAMRNKAIDKVEQR